MDQMLMDRHADVTKLQTRLAIRNGNRNSTVILESAVHITQEIDGAGMCSKTSIM